MEHVIKKLIGRVKGQVLFEGKDLKKFSRDMSMYEIQPMAVVIPADVEDMIKTLQLAADAGIPVTPRGGGSGTAGAALGKGIVIAFERKGPLNRILHFDDSAETPEITLEAGVLHNHMQRYLRERGLFLPADPTSGDISLIGGNIATKASGPHALKHGSINRYLKHLCFISNRGEFIDTSDETTIPPRMIDGIRHLDEIIRSDEQTGRRLRRRAERKIASGYNLFAFLEELPIGQLLAQLMVGSVGTLGIVTRASLRTEPYIEGKVVMTISFRDLHEAGDAVQYIRTLGVAAIEIISANTIRMVQEHREKAFKKLAPSGNPSHILLVEFEGKERFDQIEAVKKTLHQHNYNLESSPYIATDETSQAELWKNRKQLFPAILNYHPHLKALSVANDVGVAIEHLADFISDIETIFKRYQLAGAIYGHSGSGNLHLRPLFDTRRPDIKSFIRKVADEIYGAVFKYDGTITAEHGMGPLRAPYLNAEWGDTIVGYMKQLKKIMDPENRLNPGVMFSHRPITENIKV